MSIHPHATNYKYVRALFFFFELKMCVIAKHDL
jgi:hypothetical protein